MTKEQNQDEQDDQFFGRVLKEAQIGPNMFTGD